MNLSSTQRKILYIGVPIVAVLGLYMYLRSRNTTAAVATPSATSSGTTTDSNTPIGLDQLTSFESQVTDQLGQLGQAVSAVQAAQTAQPAPPANSSGYVPAPTPSTPAPIAPPTSSGTVAPAAQPTVTPSLPPGDIQTGGTTYEHITNPQEGSVLAAGGTTIYALEGTTPVPVVVNGQRTAAWNYLPAGTSLYDQANT